MFSITHLERIDIFLLLHRTGAYKISTTYEMMTVLSEIPITIEIEVGVPQISSTIISCTGYTMFDEAILDENK